MDIVLLYFGILCLLTAIAFVALVVWFIKIMNTPIHYHETPREMEDRVRRTGGWLNMHK